MFSNKEDVEINTVEGNDSPGDSDTFNKAFYAGKPQSQNITCHTSTSINSKSKSFVHFII